MFGSIGMDYFYGRLVGRRALGKKTQDLVQYCNFIHVEPNPNLLKPTSPFFGETLILNAYWPTLEIAGLPLK